MTGVKCMSVLKALSELRRGRIMRHLLKESLGVNEIAERTRMSQYHVS